MTTKTIVVKRASKRPRPAELRLSVNLDATNVASVFVEMDQDGESHLYLMLTQHNNSLVLPTMQSYNTYETGSIEPARALRIAAWLYDRALTERTRRKTGEPLNFKFKGDNGNGGKTS